MDEIRLARWQGATENEIKSIEERMTDLERERTEQAKTLVRVQTQLASLRTMVGVWSALGGVVGAGVATAVVAAVTGGFHA